MLDDYGADSSGLADTLALLPFDLIEIFSETNLLFMLSCLTCSMISLADNLDKLLWSPHTSSEQSG